MSSRCVSSTDGSTRDHGAILVLTLVLCVALAFLTGAIASYTGNSLKATKVTDHRTITLASAEGAARLGIEGLATGTACVSLSAAALTMNSSSISLSCSAVGASSYRLTSTAAYGGNSTSIEAVVAVVAGSVVVSSWRVV